MESYAWLAFPTLMHVPPSISKSVSVSHLPPTSLPGKYLGLDIISDQAEGSRGHNFTSTSTSGFSSSLRGEMTGRAQRTEHTVWWSLWLWFSFDAEPMLHSQWIKQFHSFGLRVGTGQNLLNWHGTPRRRPRQGWTWQPPAYPWPPAPVFAPQWRQLGSSGLAPSSRRRVSHSSFHGSSPLDLALWQTRF